MLFFLIDVSCATGLGERSLERVCGRNEEQSNAEVEEAIDVIGARR